MQAACRGAAHVSDVTALPLSPSHSAVMPSAVKVPSPYMSMPQILFSERLRAKGRKVFMGG